MNSVSVTFFFLKHGDFSVDVLIVEEEKKQGIRGVWWGVREENKKKTMVNGGRWRRGREGEESETDFVLKRKGRLRLARRNKGGF